MQPLISQDDRMLAWLEYAPECLIEALIRAYPDLPRVCARTVGQREEPGLGLLSE